MFRFTIERRVEFCLPDFSSGDVQLRFPAAGLSIAVWTVTQDAFTTPSGDVAPKTQTRLTFVLTKSDDGW